MVSNERKIHEEFEKQIDMNRMKNVIYGQAEKDSNYVHKYRQVNTIMDRRSQYHSPYKEDRAASPNFDAYKAYKDINDTDYTKTHKHKIVNNEPVRLEKSRSISNIF